MSAPSARGGPAQPRRAGGRRRCPVCAKPPAPAYHPFCSERCREIDLGRWLKGAYVIPGRPPGLSDDDDG